MVTLTIQPITKPAQVREIKEPFITYLLKTIKLRDSFRTIFFHVFPILIFANFVQKIKIVRSS